MQRLPPVSTSIDTSFPYTSLFRSLKRLGRPSSVREVASVVAEQSPVHAANPRLAFSVAVLLTDRRYSRHEATVDTPPPRSEENTFEHQSLMHIAYAVLRLNKKTNKRSTKELYTTDSRKL